MSFINKPGKTTSWRKMVIRQQVSDVLAYGKIITTITKAKETQKHVDSIINLAKEDNLSSRRSALAIILNTKEMNAKELVKKLFEKIAPKYKDVKGGYTKVLKLGKRRGDATEEAILQLV